jgi:hypothetical protein
MLEEGQYPAPAAGRHEKIGILHAGRDAGQLTWNTDGERFEPDR